MEDAMPAADPLRVYREICAERFGKMEQKLDDVYNVVKNGLADKVKLIGRAMWALFILLLGFFGTVIAILNLIIQHIKA
jgi:hypothetical protein